MTIALITDYGVTGWYSGELKGTICSIFPEANIVDVTHQVPRGDIRAAAFTLAASFMTFPEETVFCVAVDPGVRSSRRIVVAALDNRMIVAPDNGLIAWTLRLSTMVSVHEVDLHLLSAATALHAKNPDPFGCIAACIASGMSIDDFSKKISFWNVLPFPVTSITSQKLSTEIIAIDPFGNIVTAAAASLLDGRGGSAQLSLGNVTHDGVLANYYAEVSAGAVLIYPGSTGFIEIAVSSGSAADYFAVECGTPVELLFR